MNERVKATIGATGMILVGVLAVFFTASWVLKNSDANRILVDAEPR